MRPVPEDTTIGERRGIPGNKNEDIRRIAESKVSRSVSRKPVVGHMGNKNQEKRQTAKKIQPQVTGLTGNGIIYLHS
jgi:hypothetical protein